MSPVIHALGQFPLQLPQLQLQVQQLEKEIAQGREQLQGLLAAKDIAYYIIDIGSDPELHHRYGARIPVLVSGNEEICEVKLDLKALQTFLLDSEC